MARDIESKCKKCRRLKVKLFLKGERCYSDKCSLEKKKSERFVRRRRTSQYGLQLRGKQRVRWEYGIMENQFRRYYHLAEKSPNITGEEFLRLLERRLDNVVYRLSFSFSRAQGRQLVNHGHFLVNGRVVDIASYLMKEGDVIEFSKKSKKSPLVKQILESSREKVIPEWLEIDKEAMKGTIKRFPLKEELNQEIDLNLIVEYYSR
ncbi:MAG: 30S ribosomal protein S4 [Candidatus Aminicenantes bacterium]|nr:MAG: 30S ribosomal protein S4 [Candidatus Aminicenantes bacterium]